MNLDERLKEIKSRCESATEGPVGHDLYKDIPEDDRFYGGPAGYCLINNKTQQSIEQMTANRRFYSNARTDVPMLLEMVEFLKQSTTNIHVLEEIAEKYND